MGEAAAGDTEVHASPTHTLLFPGHLVLPVSPLWPLHTCDTISRCDHAVYARAHLWFIDLPSHLTPCTRHCLKSDHFSRPGFLDADLC